MGRIQRRRFLLSAGALLAIPRRASAQQSAKIWRIGFINGGGASYVDELRKGMRDLGYEAGKNYVIEVRVADGKYERLPALAADLVKRNVDVIVGSSTPAIDATKRATSSIPIVMALVGDPVASGFVASLARPGGNVTGLSLANTDISSKWLELARTVAPGSRIGVLADSNQPTAKWHLKNIQNAAQKLGIELRVVYAPAANDIENALASLARERVTTVIVLPSGMFSFNRAQIAQSAVKLRIASIATTREYVESGALLSYGQDYHAFMRRSAIYVDKIFKGAKPGDLPVEQPTIFELVINRATARQLDLPIPKDLLLRADEVVE
jgi:putative ABC transport system substrate-binding protein